ncbi:MAG: FAD-binding protein [Methanomassiliicoccales archaeon]|nr:FAD-binding protein [Methanomassiliicoccales archaeon]NYT14732.1 FAD-binding protein [Methanomassiliicoccales archaeon]
MEAEVLDHIAAIVGKENMSTRIADLYTYGFDASIHHNSPDLVVRPSSAEEISEIVKIANEKEIPVMPRGAGTGLCGSAVPLKGGILLDMARMNNIKDIRVEDLNCAVEAGVVYDQLNKALATRGFFFPPTPGSGEVCTIGGMIAANASGMRAIKYGATRDYVLGLRVVLANGDIIDVGTNTLKNSSGYQLERLFVGSEGTLGIITDVVLRISPKPKKSAMAVAAFDDVRKAGECVSAIIAHPLIPSAIELMDSICINAVNKTMNVGFPDCEALCLVEVDGDPLVVEKEVKQVHEICQKVGAISVEFSSDPKQMASWTAGRKAVLPALSRLGEGSVSVSLADDMGVPISKIPDAVVAFQEIAKRNGVLVGTYGHAADGNLHTKMLLDAEDPEAWRNGEKAVGEIFDKCIELGGTVTGEHGVGISKAPWMQKERASALNTMKAIKQALDPKNILNPGKLQQWEGSIITKLRYPCPEYRDK